MALEELSDADITELIEALDVALATLRRVIAWRYSPAMVEALAGLTLDELSDLRDEFVQHTEPDDDDEPD